MPKPNFTKGIEEIEREKAIGKFKRGENLKNTFHQIVSKAVWIVLVIMLFLYFILLIHRIHDADYNAIEKDFYSLIKIAGGFILGYLQQKLVSE